MIFGELLELAVANPVDAAVADVGDVDAVDNGEDGYDGRAHTSLARVALSRLEDPEVGELDPGDEPVLLVPLRTVHLVRPGSSGSSEVAEKNSRRVSIAILDADFAGGVPAHAVGHDVEAELAEDREVVSLYFVFFRRSSPATFDAESGSATAYLGRNRIGNGRAVSRVSTRSERPPPPPGRDLPRVSQRRGRTQPRGSRAVAFAADTDGQRSQARGRMTAFRIGWTRDSQALPFPMRFLPR